MKGLRASHFRRIHKGLRLDLILTVAGPVIFLVLASLLEKQMSAAGLATAEVTTDTALSFPSIWSKLLSAYLVLRYCASALCVMVIGMSLPAKLAIHSPAISALSARAGTSMTAMQKTRISEISFFIV